MGISREKIVKLHPILYHMAEPGIWDSVKKHGLLSTSALLDLHKIEGEERIRIEEHRRPRGTKPCVIQGADLEPATIRDNGPASDRKLQNCLQDGLTIRDWYKLLNGKCFFWLTQARLITLMNAYANQRHLVLEVDTEELLNRHWEKIRLTPLNTGCTSPMAFARGLRTFLPPSEYDFEGNKKKKGGPTKAIVELTVEYGVPDIAEYVCRAIRVSAAILYSGRSSEQLLKWLCEQDDPAFRLLHLPDYDPVGMDEFQRIRKRIGSRVELHMPDSLNDLFSRFSNPKLLLKPQSRALLRKMRTSAIPEIRAVTALIDRFNGGLEQECLIASGHAPACIP